MIEIDANYVDAAAPNAGAIKNGRGLVLKGKFVKLHKTQDETLLFGECSGSGKSNYAVSADFVDSTKPVYRCTCPSRQFPCKHGIGLLYAWVDGKTFSVAEIPDDIASKRGKIESRVEKKKEEATKPRKVNKTALKKKVETQLKGLDLLEKLTLDLVRAGMGNTSAKSARQIEEQAKQLGNSYLPGAQAALHSYTKLFVDEEGKFDSDVSARQRESIYGEALDQLTRLRSLIRQGRTYLSKRLDDPELAPETESGIAAWLGHAWQLRELTEAGLVEQGAELIQLAFNSNDDVARREFVDTGIWMNLGTGRIELTQTFRPYKAAKYIKADDSFFHVAKVPELCVYPGDVNPRVRWDGMVPRPIENKDYTSVRKHGHTDFASLIKEVKGHLKSPLADKRPVYALNFAKIAAVGDDVIVEDAKGERLVMTEKGMSEEPASCHLLPMLPQALHQKQTLIARFHHDLDTRQLRIKPLSIVSDSAIVRLTF
ncbi:MAG: SWIM zinc finger family protein [Planctomycetota bacterium]|nr:SWIM zinc finger family protein [Planctomycetota bacterium]